MVSGEIPFNLKSEIMWDYFRIKTLTNNAYFLLSTANVLHAVWKKRDHGSGMHGKT